MHLTAALGFELLNSHAAITTYQRGAVVRHTPIVHAIAVATLSVNIHLVPTRSGMAAAYIVPRIAAAVRDRAAARDAPPMSVAAISTTYIAAEYLVQPRTHITHSGRYCGSSSDLM